VRLRACRSSAFASFIACLIVSLSAIAVCVSCS
jgi:hypothetical protein